MPRMTPLPLEIKTLIVTTLALEGVAPNPSRTMRRCSAKDSGWTPSTPSSSGSRSASVTGFPWTPRAMIRVVTSPPSRPSPPSSPPTAPFEMTSDEALQKVKEIFAKNFGLAPEQILPESKLYEELGLDSLDAVDLVLELQDLTGKKITPEVFKGVRTVADVITIVVSLEAETETGR